MERELGDTYSLSLSLTYLGWQLFRIYDFYSAKEAALESLVLYEKINFPPGKYLSLKTYGWIELVYGNFSMAYELFSECCKAANNHHFIDGVADAIDGLATIMCEHDVTPIAAQIWGFSDAYRQIHSNPRVPADRIRHESIIQLIRRDLTSEEYQAAYEYGQRITLTDIITLIIAWKPANGWKTIAPEWPWVIPEDRP